MKINIEGRTLTAPPEVDKVVADGLFEMLVNKLYPTIPPLMQFGMMHYTRTKLRDLEASLNAAGYDGKAVRPKDGEDPNILYARIMFADMLGDMRDAQLTINTEAGTDTISSFTLPEFDPGQGGR